MTVVIHYQAQPGHQEAAKRELAGRAAVVVAEESACLGIKICQNLSDPTRFLLYERWTDREAYLGPHMQTPHLRRFIEAARQFFVGPRTITLWHQVANADPQRLKA